MIMNNWHEIEWFYDCNLDLDYVDYRTIDKLSIMITKFHYHTFFHSLQDDWKKASHEGVVIELFK